MAQGSKEKYTAKQKRQAQHIEEGYEERGASGRQAEEIAWATVNKRTGGGRLGGRLARRSPRGSRSRKRATRRT
jgi:hypothetical protein